MTLDRKAWEGIAKAIEEAAARINTKVTELDDRDDRLARGIQINSDRFVSLESRVAALENAKRIGVDLPSPERWAEVVKLAREWGRGEPVCAKIVKTICEDLP